MPLAASVVAALLFKNCGRESAKASLVHLRPIHCRPSLGQSDAVLP